VNCATDPHADRRQRLGAFGRRQQGAGRRQRAGTEQARIDAQGRQQFRRYRACG